MSQDHVEFVLKFVQFGPEVDFVPMFCDDAAWPAVREALVPLYDPDVEIVAHGLPDGDRTFVGLDEYRAGWQDWLAPWATYRAEVEKAVDLGDRVLLLYRSFGRLEGSTAELRDELASVWTVREGRSSYVEMYVTSHAEALRAVGLTD